MPIMNGMDACIDIQSYLHEESMADLKVFQNVPYVYALTAEVDEQVVRRIRTAGFKTVYHLLDKNTIKEILEGADIPYRMISERGETFRFKLESQFDNMLEEGNNSSEQESSVSHGSSSSARSKEELKLEV